MDMSKKTTKILLTFRSESGCSEAIYKKVIRLRELQQRLAEKQIAFPEYYLLCVCPRVPSYALQTPEMIDYANDTVEQGDVVLKNIGRMLDIPANRRFLAAGQADLQAYHIAKILKIDKVIGYSKPFLQILKMARSVRNYFRHVQGTLKTRYPKFLSYPH